MRFFIQRVTHAEVSVSGETLGSIRNGFLVLCGIRETDTEDIADKMIRKMCGLRIFEDENGKTNLSLADVGGGILMVSQFTLYADCRRGNRPGFTGAGRPEMAEPLYEYILGETQKYVSDVQRGRFGADMKVSLVNDGPFTILLDSDELGMQDRKA